MHHIESDRSAGLSPEEAVAVYPRAGGVLRLADMTGRGKPVAAGEIPDRLEEAVGEHMRAAVHEERLIVLSVLADVLPERRIVGRGIEAVPLLEDGIEIIVPHTAVRDIVLEIVIEGHSDHIADIVLIPVGKALVGQRDVVHRGVVAHEIRVAVLCRDADIFLDIPVALGNRPDKAFAVDERAQVNDSQVVDLNRYKAHQLRAFLGVKRALYRLSLHALVLEASQGKRRRIGECPCHLASGASGREIEVVVVDYRHIKLARLVEERLVAVVIFVGAELRQGPLMPAAFRYRKRSESAVAALFVERNIFCDVVGELSVLGEAPVHVIEGYGTVIHRHRLEVAP